MEEGAFSRILDCTFTSAEYMSEEEDKNPLGWTKDEVLTDEIIKCLDSTEESDYIYTISTQGHGAYPEEQLIDDPEITSFRSRDRGSEQSVGILL